MLTFSKGKLVRVLARRLGDSQATGLALGTRDPQEPYVARSGCFLGTLELDAAISATWLSGGRPGFCFRVLEEGGVAAGDELVEVAAAPERMTVSMSIRCYGSSQQGGARASAGAPGCHSDRSGAAAR